MTESAQPAAAAADGFPVDASTKYKIDAGQCESCGYYKTWGFKVQNKKSGKMMPGHVTAEGFKIGEGDCPKYAKFAELNKKRAEKRTTAAPGVPRPAGTWIQDVTGETAASVVQSPAFASAPTAAGVKQPAPAATPPAATVASAPPGPEPGPVIAFTVNGFTITTSMTQAASVVEQIGVALRKALGSGA
jgi:hypothetical protein